MWKPDVLSFAAVPGHDINDEEYTSGIWKPEGFDLIPSEGPDWQGEQYFHHVDDNRMMVAGQGYLNSCELSGKGYYWQASDYISQVAVFIEEAVVDPDGVYTATIATTQSQVNAFGDFSDRYTAQLDELAALVDAGRVEYVHFQDIPDLYVQGGERATQVKIAEFENTHTCVDGIEVP